MFSLVMFIPLVLAETELSQSTIDQTRASISEGERRQREAMSHLFALNQKIRTLAKKRVRFSDQLAQQEAKVRQMAQDLNSLEDKIGMQRQMLNTRLRQLYQGRSEKEFQWLFSARTPVELERNRRFLRRMVESDHAYLRTCLRDVRELTRLRAQMRTAVAKLAGFQHEVDRQESQIQIQLRAKSEFVSRLREDKDAKLSLLKELRSAAAVSADYAFFERKGLLPAPIDVPVARDFGTIVDSKFHYRLMHKGLFYATTEPREVKAISSGKVVLAADIPGYGKTIIIDHGDNYFTVYAYLKKLRRNEGETVREGDPLAFSGEISPLFGPGLYFELRHFSDAIDPRPWIKESELKTANYF
jgi:septal ring factor EnvC (AmiA/AmiB activator)